MEGDSNTVFDTIVACKKSSDEISSAGKREIREFYMEQNLVIEAIEEAESRLAELHKRSSGSSSPLAICAASEHHEVDSSSLHDMNGASEEHLAIAMELQPTVSATRKETPEKEDQKLSIQLAIWASFGANILLFTGKLIAAILTGSLVVIASTLDSALDLLSGSIIFLTHRFAKKRNAEKYPVGKLRVENLGVLIFSAVMCTASLQIILQSVQTLLGGDSKLSDFEFVAIGILGATIAIKSMLCLWCRLLAKRSMSCEALAQDHRNDVLTNSFAVLVLVLQTYISGIWFLDPVGAMLLALFIIANWITTGHHHLTLLVGKAAEKLINIQLTYFVYRFDPRISYVDTVRAYHSGARLIVEVDIILPPETTLKVSHDIGENLQNALETFEDVERAFVHIDYDFMHHSSSEHKVR